MRAWAFSFLFLISFLSVAFAWTKEDHEIFDLVSALEAAEGKGTTFYSFLDVPFGASSADIGRAYRKKSVTMHPDKNSGVKNIEERFARLGVIAKILRNKEDRERYDFFYKNGVPKWRGTGYYYERFRPGLGSVLVFLALLTSGVQYGVAQINRQRDLARIDRLSKQAKVIAYGPKGSPLEKGIKRKVRVPVSGADASDEGAKGGRMLDLVVDGSDVYFAGGHELTKFDESIVPKTLFVDTWAIALVRRLFTLLPIPSTSKPKPAGEESADVPSEDISDGFASEGNADSSDVGSGKSGKSATKRKPKRK